MLLCVSVMEERLTGITGGQGTLAFTWNGNITQHFLVVAFQLPTHLSPHTSPMTS